MNSSADLLFTLRMKVLSVNNRCLTFAPDMDRKSQSTHQQARAFQLYSWKQKWTKTEQPRAFTRAHQGHDSSTAKHCSATALIQGHVHCFHCKVKIFIVFKTTWWRGIKIKLDFWQQTHDQLDGQYLKECGILWIQHSSYLFFILSSWLFNFDATHSLLPVNLLNTLVWSLLWRLCLGLRLR